MDRTGGAEVETAARKDTFGSPWRSFNIDSLWRFFSSTKTAIVLILLIAFASFLGAVIAQAPQQIVGDPTEYGAWLAAAQGTYGSLTNLYNVLGLFNVYHVWWFTVLLLALIFNTIICTINRLPTLWSSAFSPRVRVNETMFRSAPIRATIAVKGVQRAKQSSAKQSPGKQSATQLASADSIDDLAETAFATLSAKHYKVFFEEDGATKHFYADRYGIFKLGTLITHLSLVILMIGTLMGGMFGGFRQDAVIIPDGKTYQVPLSGSDGFKVRNDKFQADFYSNGAPKDYYTDLTVIDGGKDVLTKQIRVNDPLDYKGVRFHQSFYGPAPALEVKDTSGHTLFSDLMPLSQQSGSGSAGWTRLPGSNVALIANLAFESGSSSPLDIYIFKSQSVQNRDSLKPGETKTIGDYKVTYKSMEQFTGLSVVKDPGVNVVWLACGMLVLGICLTLYFPRRRIWGRVTEHEVMMAGTADKTVNFRTEFERLVEAIRGEPGSRGPKGPASS